MDATTAQLVFGSIMAVAAGVWFVSLRMALHLGQAEPMPEDSFASFTEQPKAASDESEITGERTVRGEPESVSQAIAKSLVAVGVPGMFASLFEIRERTPEKVRIQKTGPLVCNQPTGMYFSEAEFDLHYAGENHVLVTYRIGFARLGQALRRVALMIILGLGLPVLLIVGGILWFAVVQNPNPDTRWHVLQLFQVVHVLWPPFLVMYFYRAGRTHARTYVSNVLASLEVPSPATLQH